MPDGTLPEAYQQLANRFARVYRHRRKWAKRTDVSCFRIYEREIADQPLILDWYDGTAIGWTFPRTRNETPAQEQAWHALLRAAIATGLGVADADIVLKHRRPQTGRHAGGGQYERVGAQGRTRVVSEQGLRFEINLSDYLDTGLFLDHRWTRAQVRAQAQGQRVLNLFAYTGAFTCYARAGGARASLTVDLSQTYLAWCARNLALNGFAEEPAHVLRRADCLALVAQPPPERFDCIVCDPPTFSNSTAMDRDWSVSRDHAWLIGKLERWLAPGGVLWFSTNCRTFRLDALPGWRVEDLTEASIPEDFRDRRIHHCYRLTRAA